MVDIGEADGARIGQTTEARADWWFAYLRLGFLVLGLEAIAALLYFRLEPGLQHRAVLTVVAAVTVVPCVGVQPFLRSMSRRRWRSSFSLAAALASGAVLSVCCALSGGVDSPLIYLAALPVLNASLALPPSSVTLCSVAAVGELLVLVLSDPNLVAKDTKLVAAFSLLGGTIALSLLAASSRSRLERQEADDRDRLAALAATDPLTGCANHRAFYERLDAEVQRYLRTRTPLSVLVADVDLFKSYNDSLGHQAGDGALAGVGSLLTGVARGYDLVARIGGDEFAVILPATDLATAGAVAGRMCEAVRASLLGVTLSMGVSTVVAEDPTSTRMVRDADRALYLAKRQGRDRVQVADGEADPPADGLDVRFGSDADLLAERLRQAERERREAERLLGATMSSAPVGICFVDSRYRILRVNQVLADIDGLSVEDHLGHRVEEVVPELWAQLAPVFAEVRASGRPVAADDVVVETRDDAGATHYWASTFFPIAVRSGDRGVGVIVFDVTGRQKAAEHQGEISRRVVAALAATVEMRDPYTAGHQMRVGRMAVALATELGLPPARVDDIGLAAQIHDLGKVRVPAEILSRPGALTESEFELVRAHSQVGYDILASVGFPEEMSQMVLQHHERLDGSGYPQGLRGDEICLGARVIAVADVAEAMTAPRPYRGGLGPDAAIAELRRGRGARYDEAVVDAYLRIRPDLLEASGASVPGPSHAVIRQAV